MWLTWTAVFLCVCKSQTWHVMKAVVSGAGEIKMKGELPSPFSSKTMTHWGVCAVRERGVVVEVMVWRAGPPLWSRSSLVCKILNCHSLLGKI